MRGVVDDARDGTRTKLPGHPVPAEAVEQGQERKQQVAVSGVAQAISIPPRGPAGESAER